MAREDGELRAAKRSYKEASSVGSRKEEARWANVIGHILKNRGEYVEALKWLRIDYEISLKFLPEKDLLPTCQSLGELYLRLHQFKHALIYQKKHLELAKDSQDLVEQQRAMTQLGRTYHEMFLKSDDDHYAIRNAKKYFRSAMKLTRSLKENKSSNFLKEFIDAHNNIGMLEMDLDNLEEAEKILVQGLKICDEEEVIEDDDGRSRLHHNLGYVYMVMRRWDKAREHIERDIIICKRIGHRQGESKGYINLGELHSRVQKYEEAFLCYQKALDIAKSMEDEDALVEQIDQNIETVKEAAKVTDELKNEEQNLKKLIRTTTTAKGTCRERKCLLQQNAALDCLIEKANVISAWTKHLEFAKRKKYVASDLCDKEKLSDSFLAIGESYQKLRNFTKALKWYTKSWSTYKTIGNLEGQALAKVNIGDVLDCDGDWCGALEAFEEGYRIAVEANLPSVQISALENMHYSYMIRFENVDEARRLQNIIQNLKSSRNTELDRKNLVKECCSETDTDEDEDLSHNCSSSLNSPKISESASARPKLPIGFEEFKDDVPLISLLESTKKSSKLKASHVEKQRKTSKPIEASLKGYSKSDDNQFTFSGRKRVRVVLSDDESDENDEAEISRWTYEGAFEDVMTSCEFGKSDGSTGFPDKFQDALCFASKEILSACTPINLEESTCSYKSGHSKVAAENGTDVRVRSTGEVPNDSNFPASGSKIEGDHVSDNLPHNDNYSNFNLHVSDDEHHHLTFKIEDKKIHVDAQTCMVDGYLSIECLKIEVACLYYLQLSEEKSRGLLPVIRHLKCGKEALESLEAVKNLKHNSWGNNWIEVETDGWIQKRLMKSYVDCCKKCNEAPNMKLLKKLYRLEVSEDELILSDCELQDISMTPLLDALFQHKAIAVLDLSHNLLGNETMEKLQQIFMSSSQKYGGLTLDFHCNRLGPTSLFQICECPVLLARLEVLNISGNRLTDACGSYLSTILENCKALYSLNIEHCSISSRTIQKVADAIGSGSVLTQLCLGHNPISGNALVNLLAKLGTLKRFAELNLNGVKLSKPVIDGLCMLAKKSCLSGLMLGSTSIGADGALTLMNALSTGAQELVKFDLSFCGLTCHSFVALFTDLASGSGILELNLGGNSIGPEGLNALVSLLENAQCSLKILVLNKSHLGLAGIAKIICALEENKSLEELNLSENANVDDDITPHYDSTQEMSSKSLQQNINSSDINPSKCASEKTEDAQQGVCAVNSECNELEVADSEDEDQIKCERVVSSLNDSCTSSCKIDISTTAFPMSQLIEDLATAIGKAKNLKMLDLSNNGLTNEVADYLYTAWSSRLGSAYSSQKHITKQLAHFSVQGKSCCGIKLCCKRD